MIDYLLQAPVAPTRITVFSEWTEAWKSLVPLWKSPIDRALAGGFAADRPAWAFAAGYQAALQRLRPAADPTRIAAICITEKGGQHPARIQCRLTPSADGPGWRLDGDKAFVSGAGEAEILLVAASIGFSPDGRNCLRMVSVPADSKGVTVMPLPPLGMVPEIPHGQVRFQGVTLDDAALLPGDGYSKAVKPFRTLEDLHVTGAFLAWIFGVGRRAGWPAEALETLLALMVTVRSLSLASPHEPQVHLALGGLLAQVRAWLETNAPLWQTVEEPVKAWWYRDRPILGIAEAVRQQRLAKARTYFEDQ
ncbi:MAG: acyl-CoA dehydrogenase family protein [Desulfobacteraceae bacterium]|nr:acyl-CoA dehydrogenase family protein [Desulfobacteraceae bacterium]